MRLRNPTQMITMGKSFQFCAQTAKSSEFEQHIPRDNYYKLSANDVLAPKYKMFWLSLFSETLAGQSSGIVNN